MHLFSLHKAGPLTSLSILLIPHSYSELTPSLGPGPAKVRHQRAAVPLAPGGGGFPGTPAWLSSGNMFSYNTVFADQVGGVGAGCVY